MLLQIHLYPLVLMCFVTNVMGSSSRSLIMGGADADPVYPFFTTIDRYVNDTFSYPCGATLIHPDVLLTSAHCYSPLVKYIFAKVNNTKTSSVRDYVGKQVVRLRIHEGWNPEQLQNDIMLLVLKDPIYDITPVRYNVESTIPSDKDTLIVLGTGQLEYGKGGRIPDHLQQVDVPVVDMETCKSNYAGDTTKNLALEARSHICAGSAGKDACGGDSGGPALMRVGNEDVQVGIISFGIGCGLERFPGIYTRVSKYAAWLEANICDVSIIGCSTPSPTQSPSTAQPTVRPTQPPSDAPTAKPTNRPTSIPTSAPTDVPTLAPTQTPTSRPTDEPTSPPTDTPTTIPTSVPTAIPSTAPTLEPTTSTPSVHPSLFPSKVASAAPSSSPSSNPSTVPSMVPSTLSVGVTGVLPLKTDWFMPSSPSPQQQSAQANYASADRGIPEEETSSSSDSLMSRRFLFLLAGACFYLCL